MKRLELINHINRNKEKISKLGVAHLYIFGSHARDEAGPSSDVDIFVDVKKDGTFGFNQFMDLRRFCKRILKTRVDVGTRDGLHPRLKKDIEKNAIKVF